MEQTESLHPESTTTDKTLNHQETSHHQNHHHHHHSHQNHQHTEQTTTATVSKELTIPKFYAGKSVFVTGATGFMGKVLLEKLLRCCPEVEGIYCLMRPKNKRDVSQRLNELVSSKIFEKLRSEQPAFEKKIIPVCGDIMEPALGISEEDAAMLQHKINIVFHSAATIRFDEPLRVAMMMNVVAVQKMIKLCRTFKHLEAFVHVSTAFANCDQPHIDETIYKPTTDPQKIVDVLEWMDDDMLEVLTERFLGKKPNTYTFSKHLAEWLLLTEGSGLPLAIVRPSIVGATWKEPFPGWLDNFNGPSGLTVAFGKGIMRSMQGGQDNVADVIPVDVPINVMLAVAWYTALARPSQLLVYHSTSGAFTPVTWGEMQVLVVDAFERTPMERCFRRPTKKCITSNRVVHDCMVFASHMVPAYLTDMVYRIIGKKPMMVRVYQKLHRALDTLTFFTMRSWTWSSNNLDILRHQMTPDDLKVFYLDTQLLQWEKYMEDYCAGTKKYLLREDLKSLSKARAHLRMLRNLVYLFKTLMVVVVWRVLIARSQIARDIWRLIVKLVFRFVRYFRITSSV